MNTITIAALVTAFVLVAIGFASGKPSPFAPIGKQEWGSGSWLTNASVIAGLVTQLLALAPAKVDPAGEIRLLAAIFTLVGAIAPLLFNFLTTPGTGEGSVAAFALSAGATLFAMAGQYQAGLVVIGKLGPAEAGLTPAFVQFVLRAFWIVLGVLMAIHAIRAIRHLTGRLPAAADVAQPRRFLAL